jgi:hypothetical protein
MEAQSMVHDFKTLIISFHPVIVIETVEEERVEDLVRAVSRELNLTLFDWTVTQGLKRAGNDMAIHGTADPIGVVRHIEDLTVDSIFFLKDFARHLKTDAVARKFREVAQKFSHSLSTIIVTGQAIDLPADVEHNAVHYQLSLPGKEELRKAIWPVVESLTARQNVEFAMEKDDVEDLLGALSGMTLNQARQIVAYAALFDGKLTAKDIERVTERKAQVIRDGGLLEYFPVQDNKYQLGGFTRLKAWLERARVGFSDQARELNLQPPRGIFIVGLQGCGKSLAAKVIAREWKLPLLKLDAGRLFDKYIGESEKNFRKAIALAESMSPAVLWIDEIEKAMPTSGAGTGDGGVSRRLFGAFLTWLQEKNEPVFVVATANDLTHTPPELLRKGRFDEVFFVDLPVPEERAKIFDIHLNLRKQNPGDFDIETLVEQSDGFSGAEIEQAVVGGLYRALHQNQTLDTALLVTELTETVPLSVSKHEDIQRLRQLAEGRFVNVH